MQEAEIREAAYSASKLKGADRINYIFNSYQNAKADWHKILQLASFFDKEQIEMCKYNDNGRLII